MESIQLGHSELQSSRLVYGCMRITDFEGADAREQGMRALRTAIEEGYTHFDHADIYSGGKSELLFSELLKERPSLRDHLVLTSKCGIRGKGRPNADDPARYDFSKDYIVQSVEGSLRRLGIDQLDILLLHRPDFLMRAEEVGEAFSQLHAEGKVAHFGVSNFKPSQVSLLQKSLSNPLLVNQIEINIHNVDSLYDGTLDQCQELGISPQAWCPLGGVAYPAWGNTFTEADEQRIEKELARQSEKYDTENWIVMLAWLLKHPADILPVIGTTNPGRIQAARKSLALNYSREDWYRLLEARNGKSVD